VPTYRLNKFRGEWAVAVWEDGKRTGRYSLGTADRKEAERLLAKHQRDREKPAHVTLTYLWGAYGKEKAGKRIVENMVFSGRAVLPHLGHLLPDEITTDRCRQYVRHRRRMGRKVGTIWTELNHAQIVLNWATEQRLIPYSVAIDRPPKPAPKDRRLTAPESQKLLDAAKVPHVRLAIALMLNTGARSGAVLDLTWDRVDLARGLIHYADPDDSGHRKGRATVPINKPLRPLLEDAKRGAMTPYVIEWAGEQVGSVKRGFAKAVKDAGLANVTPHVLRHTAASRMAEAGIPMTRIAAVLGHSDSRTTERIYAKFAPDYLRDAVDALDTSGVPSRSAEPTERNDE
jgi:integrase